MKQANIRDINFHSLRHTFATHCITNGMDVKSLSEIFRAFKYYYYNETLCASLFRDKKKPIRKSH